MRSETKMASVENPRIRCFQVKSVQHVEIGNLLPSVLCNEVGPRTHLSSDDLLYPSLRKHDKRLQRIGVYIVLEFRIWKIPK